MNNFHFQCRTNKKKLPDCQVNLSEDTDSFVCNCHDRIVDEL